MIKNGTKIETQVHRKTANTGFLLHFKSHTGKHSKVALLKTIGSSSNHDDDGNKNPTNLHI